MPQNEPLLAFKVLLVDDELLLQTAGGRATHELWENYMVVGDDIVHFFLIHSPSCSEVSFLSEAVCKGLRSQYPRPLNQPESKGEHYFPHSL